MLAGAAAPGWVKGTRGAGRALSAGFEKGKLWSLYFNFHFQKSTETTNGANKQIVKKIREKK